jgi:hypothetical protein
VHDGGELAPSYSVTVSDGALSVGPAAAAISFANVNDAPTLGSNALTISEGGTVTLSAANLSATDVDNAAGTLTFDVSSVSNGRFERASAPGVAITSFTQAELVAGDIVFVHDGGELAPSYSVTVSDGALSDGPSAVGVSYTPVAKVSGIEVFGTVLPPEAPAPPGDNTLPAPSVAVSLAPLPEVAAAAPQAHETPLVIDLGRGRGLRELSGSGRLRVVADAHHDTSDAPAWQNPLRVLLAKLNLERAFDVVDGDMHRHANAGERHEFRLAATFAGAVIALSAGLVAFLLRAGSLFAALVASLPAWQRFDVLSVLVLSEKERNDREQAIARAAEAELRDDAGLAGIFGDLKSQTKGAARDRSEKPDSQHADT